MKNIAIYRLRRAEAAVQAMAESVAQLEASIGNAGGGMPASGALPEPVRNELNALRSEVAKLRAAAANASPNAPAPPNAMSAKAPAPQTANAPSPGQTAEAERELARLRDEVQNLREALAVSRNFASESVTRMEAEQKAWTTEREQLIAELAAATQKAERASSRFKQSEGVRADLEQQIGTLKQRLKDTEAQAKAELARITAEKEAAEESAAANLAALNEQAAAAKNMEQSTATVKPVPDLAPQLQAMEGKVTTVEAKNAELLAELNALKEKSATTIEKLQSLEAKNLRLRQANGAVSQRLDGAIQKVQALLQGS